MKRIPFYWMNVYWNKPSDKPEVLSNPIDTTAMQCPVCGGYTKLCSC